MSTSERVPAGMSPHVSGGEMPSPSAVNLIGRRWPSRNAGLFQLDPFVRQRDAMTGRHQFFVTSPEIAHQRAEPAGNVFKHVVSELPSRNQQVPIGFTVAHRKCHRWIVSAVSNARRRS